MVVCGNSNRPVKRTVKKRQSRYIGVIEIHFEIELFSVFPGKLEHLQREVNTVKLKSAAGKGQKVRPVPAPQVYERSFLPPLCQFVEFMPEDGEVAEVVPRGRNPVKDVRGFSFWQVYTFLSSVKRFRMPGFSGVPRTSLCT